MAEGPVKYGELIVLGHNGDETRMKRQFVLCKRERANGVKPSLLHTHSQALGVGDQHNVSYRISQDATVDVAYVNDRKTDMFQIGRSEQSPIDFVMVDTVPLPASVLSGIPRFGCRVVCQRSPPHTARLYAACFDSSNNIKLGENAVKWMTRDRQMDALTTNGVLVMRPDPLHGFTQDYQPGLWREISVCGDVFSLRETHTPQQQGNRVDGESQDLVDGSLIDLGGVTLLWRTAEGLAQQHAPATEHLEVQRQEIYAQRPCFVYKIKKDGSASSLCGPPPKQPPPPPPPPPSALLPVPKKEEVVALGEALLGGLGEALLGQIHKGIVLKKVKKVVAQ